MLTVKSERIFAFIFNKEYYLWYSIMNFRQFILRKIDLIFFFKYKTEYRYWLH